MVDIVIWRNKMSQSKVTRKQVQKILNDLEVDNPFTLRTVDFSDLARARPQFVTIKEWTPNPSAEEIKETIESKLPVVVQFKAKKGIAMIG
jgi:hypothetical protein